MPLCPRGPNHSPSSNFHGSAEHSVCVCSRDQLGDWDPTASLQSQAARLHSVPRPGSDSTLPVFSSRYSPSHTLLCEVCAPSDTQDSVCRAELGLPRWHSDKASTRESRRCKNHRFDPWVGKIPWRRAWQPTPVFLLENPMTVEPCGPQSVGLQEIEHHGATRDRFIPGKSCRIEHLLCAALPVLRLPSLTGGLLPREGLVHPPGGTAGWQGWIRGGLQSRPCCPQDSGTPHPCLVHACGSGPRGQAVS